MSIVLAVTLLPGVISQSLAAEMHAAKLESAWPACDTRIKSQRLTFVHVSDLHAHYNPDRSGSSAYARLRGFYEQTRLENPFTLFINGGDDHERGSIAEVRSRGQTTRELTQRMGYHARVLGNHDFAFGLEEVMAFSQDPTALVLASNIRMADGSNDMSTGWSSYGELAVGCLRVGFFGLLSRPWNEFGRQSDDSYYPQLAADYHFVEVAREIIARHRRDVDLLVLVSHLGMYEDQRLAEATSGIDLILGGHTHSKLESPLQIGGTTIVHVGSNGQHVGRLDLEFDLEESAVRSRQFKLRRNGPDDDLPVDPSMQLAVEDALRPFRLELQQEFAWVSASVEREEVSRIAARAAVTRLGVDAALIRRDAAGKGWQPGGLTQQMVLDAFKVVREPVGQPGTSSFYRVELSGSDLLQLRKANRDYILEGPDWIDPNRTYSLALQKPQALHQEESFGMRLGSKNPRPLAELWETVVAFGQVRSAARLAIDSDETILPEELIASVRPGTKSQRPGL